MKGTNSKPLGNVRDSSSFHLFNGKLGIFTKCVEAETEVLSWMQKLLGGVFWTIMQETKVGNCNGHI